MPTTYTDQFWLIDAFNPPPVGTTLTVSVFDIVDQNDDNLISAFFSADSIDGVDIISAYPGDEITAIIPPTPPGGGVPITFVGTTFYLADGRVVFTPTDGQTLATGELSGTDFVPNQGPTDTALLSPPCFVNGTLIATPDGTRPVEDLVAGDQITGYQGETLTLRKVFKRSLSQRALASNPKLKPIRIMAGSLGSGLPSRDLLVSRQHRMLLQSKVSERMFGKPEVLVAAIRLTDLPGIFVDESAGTLTYYHLLFDEHEVIMAEGAPTESLFTGPEALKSIDDEAREELLTLFPEIADADYTPAPARLIPSGSQQKQLVARHLKNSKPVLNPV